MRIVKDNLKHIITITFLIFLGTELYASDSLLTKGISELKARKSGEAVQTFAAILSNPKLSNIHADAMYWLAKTKIGLKDYSNASEVIDEFLVKYSNDKRVQEIQYHKARLYYLLGEPEKALVELGKFIEFTPGGPLYISALYWTGESLMALGQLDEAKKVFSHIVSKYKDSIKYAPSEYRLREISYLEREQVLLDLLRWSYEAHMQDLETLYYQSTAGDHADSKITDGTEDDKAAAEKASREAAILKRVKEARDRLAEMKNISNVNKLKEIIIDDMETQ